MPMKSSIFNGCFLLLLGFVTGCSYDSYLVEMEPDGDAFQRTITAWQTESKDGSISQISKEQLRHFLDVYPTRVTPPEAATQTFRGRFTDGRTPDDLGGSGTYTRFSSPLGVVGAYLENFQGNNNPAGVLDTRFQDIDRFVDILEGWLEKEFGNEKEFAVLRNSISRHLKVDMRNLALLYWWGRSSGNEDSEILGRFAQYLAEQGYFSIKELPSIIKALEEEDPMLFGLVLNRKSGLRKDGELCRRIEQWLDEKDGGKMRNSLSRYMATTAEYRKLLRDWEETAKAQPDLEKPEPMEAFDRLAEGALPWSLGGNPSNRLEVRLKVRAQPFETTGTWDPNKQQVVWTRKIGDGNHLPAFCYAVWSVPNVTFQEKHLGRAALVGESLAEYVFEYGALAENERQVWDEFIRGLKPETALKGLNAFSFQAAMKGVGGKTAEAPMEKLRHKLVEALGQEKHPK